MSARFADARPSPLAVVVALTALSCAAMVATAQDVRTLPFEIGEHEGVPWPIVPAPVLGPLPPAPSLTPGAAATPAAQRIIARIDEIAHTLRETAYEHATVVRERDGVYRWDCSGMAAWILRREAPRAMRAITSERPLARDFVRAIERAPVHRARGGWQRLETLAEAQPGDIFSWRRPRGFPSRNTGHVGFVLAAPTAVPGIPGAYAVRVADATSWGHQDDTRRDDGTGGFGFGTISFLVDATGAGTHYGWYGTLSEGYVVTPIVMGRVSR